MKGFWLLAACLAILLSAMFYKSFLPGMVVFSNDGPYGAISSQKALLPSAYRGLWEDLNWVGGESVGASPNLSSILGLIMGPLGFAKFYAPIACLVLGLCAWKMFRAFRLDPAVCVIGGLAAGLNSCFFSTACWGVAAQPICFGANYLALAALADLSGRRAWLRVILAGFAVGWGVMEGFDIGAIFSLVVAAFVIFQSWNTEPRPGFAKAGGLGVARVAVVAVFAAFISAHTVNSLINTQIKGVMGTAQDAATRQRQWQFATQWSTPKIETLQILVPGIFGWRMFDGDYHLTPNSYWGQIGASPMIEELEKMLASPDEQTRAQAAGALGDYTIWRFSGTGLYAGVLVVVVAIWAVLQGFRKQGPFTLFQRRAIRFWFVVGVVGLLLALGRFAPFYQFFYALPYTSTIRNPFKFMHVFSWSLVILFGYGLDGIVRIYLRDTAARVQAAPVRFKSWLAAASPFERKWMLGCFGAVAVGFVAMITYAALFADVKAQVHSVGVPPDMAPLIARTSVHAMYWFEFFLVLTVALLALIFSGRFAGAASRWGVLLLGLVLATDLCRADWPWVEDWNVPVKYASNPIVDILRDKPWEHRVAIAPISGPDPQSGTFNQLYQIEWKQQVFPYYNIQNLDVVMEPRETTDNNAFRQYVSARSMATLARHWQLTNTRYLLGPAELSATDARTHTPVAVSTADVLNQQLDPVRRRFRILQRFTLLPKTKEPATSLTMTTAMPDPNGPLAVVDFTGALPRASLYSNWVVQTNRDDALTLLADANFDPTQTVVVGDEIPGPPPASTNQTAGAVRIKPNYRPKRMELEADAQTSCVLLLNDHYSPSWHVTVDGRTAPLLRCNFIMRGVTLSPGHHEIVFQYVKSMTAFYISLFAVVLALCLSGWLAFDNPEELTETATRSATDRSADKRKQVAT